MPSGNKGSFTFLFLIFMLFLPFYLTVLSRTFSVKLIRRWQSPLSSCWSHGYSKHYVTTKCDVSFCKCSLSGEGLVSSIPSLVFLSLADA